MTMRLLPWSGEGGKPAYLSAEDENSYLSRLADDLEAVQLGMAGRLLDYVQMALADGKLSETELRSMVGFLCEALRDARGVAGSRGARLLVRGEGAGCACAVARETAAREGGVAQAACGVGGAGGEDRSGLVVRRWRPVGESVGVARRLLRSYLEAWGMAAVADTGVLVLSELLTNAVQYGSGPPDRLVETRFERLPDGRLRIEVHDASGVRPQRRDVSLDAESGRGLALVDVLTGGCWGVSDRTGVGKLTWAVCADAAAPQIPGVSG